LRSYFSKKIIRRKSIAVLLWVAGIVEFLRLTNVYHRLVVRLIRNTGLFDEDHYRSQNPDILKSGQDPLLHYVVWGDREGRSPMPFFDPIHYRACARPFKPQSINTLLHYAFVGRYEGYATSPYFDPAYYSAHNHDVKYSGMDPILHFTRRGWKEGRCPSPMVNSDRFFQAVRKKAGSNHTSKQDDEAEATVDVESQIRDLLWRTSPPSDADWEALPVPERREPVHVDVIVPVFAGMAETLQCLYNVLRFRQEAAFELVVINDASPDMQLVYSLRRLAARGYFTYLTNDVNLGFVKSANRGIRLHTDRDVVLLNSDTEPYNNWLDRLRTAAYREPNVATVTPLSNSATICSYPVFKQDNPFPLEVSGEELDRYAGDVNRGQSISSPTAVGFCMYLRRPALAEVGLLDEIGFQLGYGEENDFSQRALTAGWKNVIATDVYVWHWSSTSFRGDRGKHMLRAMQVLKNRYPSYHSDVAAFIAKDPLMPARRRLDEARLQRYVAARNVLLVTHRRGGGTQRFITDQVKRYQQDGTGVFFLLPAADRKHGCLSAPGAAGFPNLAALDFQDKAQLLSMFKRLSISRIEVHQLIDFDEAAAGSLVQCARSLGIRLEVFVHDYQAICPRVNLVGPNGVFCGELSGRECSPCLEKRRKGQPSPLSMNIVNWRRRFRILYEAADQINVPDEDVKARLRRYFNISKIVVRSHEGKTSPPAVCLNRIEPGENLRIVVIGAISVAKGFNVLRACSADARRRRLPLKFILMGFSAKDRELQKAGVDITGRYHDDLAKDTLGALRPHLIWLPSVWPETYSYTLSIALKSGCPVAAFDIGVIPARLRRDGREEMIMPLQWAHLPRRINEEFMQFRSRCGHERSAG
jgi:GT2 family glycosyltransferase